MRRKDVFISAVSRDLGSFREVAKRALYDIGAHPVEQDNFPTDHRQLDIALADRVDRCDAVVHIAGISYGSEPAHSQGRPRRSHTQWEYYRAVEGPHPKPTYIFLALPDCPFDTSEPEDSERESLQREHRKQLKQSGSYYYEFANKEELRDRILRCDALRALATPRLARIHFRPLGKRFTGRKEIWDLLQDDLKGGSKVLSEPIVIRGTGGVGKTALAVELGWRLFEAGRFRFVFFFNASAPETLDVDLATLSDERALDLPELTDAAERRNAVLSWLATPENGELTLLIFDGVDAPEAREAVRRLLPRVLHCAVLVTSSYTEWGNATVRELELFTPIEAREYLRSRLEAALLTTSNEAALDGIARALDHLPVALELVASYIRDTRQSPAEWLAEWHSVPASTLQHHDPDVVGYPVSLARVWDQSVARLTPLAREFLCVFASLAPRPAVVPLTPIRKQPNWHAVRDVLVELAKASLISWPQGIDALSIHRVLQAILLHRMNEDQRKGSIKLALTMMQALQPPPEYDEANWRIWAQLEPHLLTLIQRLTKLRFGIDARAVLGSYATFLHYGARYAEAEMLYRRTAAMAQRQNGPDSPQLATELTSLSSVLLARGHVTKAEGAARRALVIFESLPQPHPDLCFCLNNLSEILAATDRLAEAVEMSERAVSASTEVFGPGHPHTLAWIHNLATRFLELGRRLDAEALFRQLLAALEAATDPSPPRVAATLNQLAELARVDGRFSEAEQMYRRAIGISEACYGSEHPEIASYANNLALTLGALGQRDRAAEAEKLFARAMSIDVKVFGQEHPKVANRLSNLAWLFQQTGRVAESEPLLRQAIEILVRFRVHTAQDHTDWKSTWDQYRRLLLDIGLDEDAIEKRYEEIVEKANREIGGQRS